MNSLSMCSESNSGNRNANVSAELDAMLLGDQNNDNVNKNRASPFYGNANN